jgi:uncharacterized protein (TIGR02145 family)
MKTKKYLLAFAGIILFLSGLTGLKAQTVTDIDGNVYNTVTIGTQVWMKENLRTTRYADGTAIPNVPDSAKWAALNVTDKAYCFYNNSSTNANTYGALYTWAAAMKGASSSSSSPSSIQGICPTGWHLPSHAEWTTLIAYLGGYTMAGGKLKETDTTHWQSPNTGATNESSFTALPSGRRFFNGKFMYIRDQGYWWSSTVSADQLVMLPPRGKGPGRIIGTYPTAWSPAVTSIENSIGDNAYRQKAGLPVRCVCELNFGLLPVVCVDAEAFNLTQGSPAGGIYSGPGIVTSPKFDPAIAGVGTHSVTYSYTYSNGSTYSAKQTITVIATPEITFGSVPEVCVDAAAFNLTQGSPAGGTYNGTGIDASPRFDPAKAGVGTHSITYSYYGCENSATQTITVNAKPNITIGSIPEVCVDAAAFNLAQCSPSGGTYSGPGIGVSPQFDPGIAGIGTHSITYTYTDRKGCTNSATQTITVFDSTSTGIKENGEKSNNKTILTQNYPNPFSSQTVINYNLIAAGEVNLSIYDLTGRKITTLVEEKQPAGSYEVKWNAEGITPGIYFCELKAGYNRQVMKMILAKWSL